MVTNGKLGGCAGRPELLTQLIYAIHVWSALLCTLNQEKKAGRLVQGVLKCFKRHPDQEQHGAGAAGHEMG